MIIRLSIAMMRKGVRPIAATRPMIFRLYPTKEMRTGTRLLNRNRSTYSALAACEITVATAPPVTPMSNRKMNTGSRTMFSAAPSITDFMPTLA